MAKLFRVRADGFECYGLTNVAVIGLDFEQQTDKYCFKLRSFANIKSTGCGPSEQKAIEAAAAAVGSDGWSKNSRSKTCPIASNFFSCETVVDMKISHSDCNKYFSK